MRARALSGIVDFRKRRGPLGTRPVRQRVPIVRTGHDSRGEVNAERPRLSAVRSGRLLGCWALSSR